jgi:hypothetical protein
MPRVPEACRTNHRPKQLPSDPTSSQDESVSKREVQRRERLAVNLFDCDRIEPTVRQMMLGGKLKLEAIRVDPDRGDEVGVEFCCDLLTAAAICDVIRSHDRELGDCLTRVYVFRRTWTKLSSTAVLSRIGKDGILRLSEELFAREVKPAPWKPAQGRPMKFKGAR